MTHLIKTDAGDPRLAPYRDLKANRKWAAPEGFIVETELVLERLLSSEFETTEVILSESKANRLRQTIPQDIPVFVLERSELEKLVGFDLHRGVLARARRPEALFPPPLSPLQVDQRWLFGENVTDPGNVGTLIRIASTLGFDGVYFDPASSNPFSRRAARASAGHIFRLPVHVVETSALLTHFSSGSVIAAALKDDSLSSFELKASATATLLAVGNEGFGLSDDVLGAATATVKIPMVESDDSLNVATAAAILCHQLSNLRGPM